MDYTSLLDRYRAAVKRLQATIKAPGSVDYMSRSGDKEACLRRTRSFFELLGNPQNNFRVVHVAGTAGKGSTTHLIASMLYADDKHVAALTSPFVTTTLENIWINGKLCDPELFVRITHHVLDIAEGIEANSRPSYAEMLFAIGILCAREEGCEWLCVETGCGGRFDYTNIFSHTELCVLTPIDYDHTDILGHTLAQIAWHKAGIIHAGTCVVSAEQPVEVRRVFEAEAAKYPDVTLSFCDNPLAQHAHDAIDRDAVQQAFVPASAPTLTPLAGSHQQRNKQLARAAASILGVSESAQQIGITETRLPARCENLQEKPLVIIDGAHSPIKMHALAEYMRTLQYERLFVIYSAKYSKDAQENISPLLPLIDELWCTEFHLPGFSSHTSSDMCRSIRAMDNTLIVHEEPRSLAALDAALKSAASQDCILITGSLYLAGILREHWVREEDIVLNRDCFPQIAFR